MEKGRDLVMTEEQSNLDIALDLWQKNRHVEAIDKLNLYINKQEGRDDLAEGFVYKGWILEDSGKYEQSIACFDKVLTLSKDDFLTAYSLYGRGKALLNLGKYLDAENDLVRAHSIYKKMFADDAEMEEHYWGCLWLLIDVMIHVEKFDDVKKMSNDHSFKAPVWFLRQMNVSLGDYYFKNKKYHDSIQHYQKALEFSDEHNEAYAETCCFLGSAMCELGQLAEGKRLIQEWMKLVQNDRIKKGVMTYLTK